jgi:hypothetical protein
MFKSLPVTNQESEPKKELFKGDGDKENAEPEKLDEEQKEGNWYD